MVEGNFIYPAVIQWRLKIVSPLSGSVLDKHSEPNTLMCHRSPEAFATVSAESRTERLIIFNKGEDLHCAHVTNISWFAILVVVFLLGSCHFKVLGYCLVMLFRKTSNFPIKLTWLKSFSIGASVL